MIQLNILTAKDDWVVFNYPISACLKELRSLGVRVHFHFQPNHKVFQGDCVWISSKALKPLWKERKDEAMRFMELAASSGRSISWFDNTDSAGTIQSWILPFVSKYFKGQLLRNQEAYCGQLYGGRAFTDFYHRRFGVSDGVDSLDGWNEVKERDLSKLSLSWNSGVGSLWMGANKTQIRRRHYYSAAVTHLPNLANSLLPAPPVSVDFTAPESDQRSTRLSARFHAYYSRPTIAYQRSHLKASLEKSNVPTGRIPLDEYYAELRSSVAAVSPFGWGEVCYRDWEIIRAGAALVKPDMSHLETWPDPYVAGESYLPFKWDFSDFEALMAAVNNKTEMMRLADNAQKSLAPLIAPDARLRFAQRLKSFLEQK